MNVGGFANGQFANVLGRFATSLLCSSDKSLCVCKTITKSTEDSDRNNSDEGKVSEKEV